MKFPVFDSIFIIFLLAVIGLSLSMRVSEGFDTFTSASTTNPASATATNPASATSTNPVPANPVPSNPVPANPVPANPVPANPLPANPLPANPASLGPSSATGFVTALMNATKLPGNESIGKTIASISVNPVPKSPYTASRCLEMEMGVRKNGTMTCYPYNFSFQSPSSSYKIIEHPL